MESLQDFQLDKAVETRVLAFDEEVRAFRDQGPLDPVAARKLQEYFRVQHIYHSTGIEGNRLSIRETEIVLVEGLQLDDRPLADQQEVRDLDAAYHFLEELATQPTPMREVDVREMQRLVVRNRSEAQPGAYRTIGVVITGSEHKPPEPVVVPGAVHGLVEWLNSTPPRFPIAAAAYAHHQLAAIHPFVDGNGRTARLLMNLVLLRSGYPIVNIRREDRAKYYESLSFADLGLYDPLVELILDRANDVFTEMKRVREETERMKVYAERWGQTEAAVIQRREDREYKIWLGQMENVRLEFENVADLLDERLKEIRIQFWKYPEPSFAKFLELRDRGRTPQCWFFRIRVHRASSHAEENFMFSFFRNFSVYSPARKIIPLVANRADGEGQYAFLDTPKIRLRDLFIESGQLHVRFQPLDNPDTQSISDKIDAGQAARDFFDDVLKECFGLKHY
jgi:cell filamentation protein, protein adenylyltransferase